MQIKTSELQGAALDWAVETIECEGAMYSGRSPRAFSTNWALGGPIIEREGMQLQMEDRNAWRASVWWDDTTGTGEVIQDGPTSLIAAMRCFVASRLGDEIEVLNELIGE